MCKGLENLVIKLKTEWNNIKKETSNYLMVVHLNEIVYLSMLIVIFNYFYL
jgi:hypothetical protein